MSQEFLTKKRERINISNSLSTNISEELGEKYYSLFITSKCIYCLKTIIKDDKVECKRCFRSFHKNCIYEITDHETNIIKEICVFCKNEIQNTCCKCSNILNKKQDIILQCELCGNKYHYKCFKFPLYYIFRKYCYFEFITKNNGFDYEEKYNKLLIEISNLDKIKNITFNDLKNVIKKCKFNDRISDILLNNIFFVCIVCQLKKYYKFNEEIIMHNATALQKITFTKKIGKIHELIVPLNSIKEKVDTINYDKSPSIKKIIGEFTYKNYKKENKSMKKKNYYLIFWDNNEYTIELDNFIKCFNEFDNYYEEYIKNKEIDSIEKSYFQSQNEFKELLKQYKNNKNNDSNVIFNENQFIYSENEFIEKFRNEQMKNLFDFLNKNNNEYAKILIFTDNIEIKNFYINYFNEKYSYVLIDNNSIDKIFYECIKLNSKNKKHYSIEEYYENIKENSSDLKNDILQFFQKMEIDNINDLIPDIIFISPNILEEINFITLSIILYFKFDLIIIDVSNSEKFSNYFHIISKLLNEKNNINQSSLIYLFMSATSVNNEIIQNHCLDFFSLYFDKDDSLLTDIDQLFGSTKLNILNSKLKKISGYDLNRITLNNKSWNFTLGKNGPKFLNILSSLWSSHITIKYCNNDHNFSRIIINLIPINIDIEAFQQYLIILKEKKEIVSRPSENKKDLFKALLMMCTFPNAMPKFYITHLESSLPVKENINPAKAEVLYQLKKILEKKNEEEKSQIIIIYSIDDKTYIEISDVIKRDLKRIMNSNTKKLNINFEIFFIEEQELYEFIEQIKIKTYIIFFNVFLNEKNCFFLYDKLIKKNKEINNKIIIFQFYINNLFEDNLLQIMYSRFEEMFQVIQGPQNKVTLYSQMINEERDCIVVRNLKETLNNYFENPTILNENNMILNYSDDIEKNCDGLIYVKKDFFILCKNSQDISTKIKIKIDRKILNDLKFLDNSEDKFKEIESNEKNNISNSEDIEFIEEIQGDKNEENINENNNNENNINETYNNNNFQKDIEESQNNESNDNSENNLIKNNNNKEIIYDNDIEEEDIKKDRKLYKFLKVLLKKQQDKDRERENENNEEENNDEEMEENNEGNNDYDEIIQNEYSDELFVKLKNNLNYDIIYYNNHEKESKSTKNESQLDDIGLNIQNIQRTANILKDITKSNGY